MRAGLVRTSDEVAASLQFCLNLSRQDLCIFFQRGLILFVYVDDIIAAGTDSQLDRFETLLSEEFSINSLGFLNGFET